MLFVSLQLPSRHCEYTSGMQEHKSRVVAHTEHQPERISNTDCDKAFVAFVWGNQPQFLVCALVLGDTLKRLCGSAARRELLVSEDSDFAKGQTREALSIYWNVTNVKTITLPGVSSVQRHDSVFTKLHAFGLHAKQLLVLDLDIHVRSARILELFSLKAPAGMYHGRPSLACVAPRECTTQGHCSCLKHGEMIAENAFSHGSCVNCGVLRLDPAQHPSMESLLEAASQIRVPSALPEQYFLSKELKGWRHLSSIFNWEVGAEIEIRQYGVHVHSTGEWARVETDDSGEDHNDVRNTIVIFHFSGNYCLPWEYMDLSKEETTKCLQKRYGFRDPRGRVSHAIIAWCESVRTLHKTRTTALIQVLSKAVEQLKQQAYQMRRWQTHWCDRCNRAAETFAVGDDAIWLCALCALWQHHSKLEKNILAQNGSLAGRWIDDHEDIAEITVEEGELNVCYKDWQARLQVQQDAELTTEESDDDGHWTYARPLKATWRCPWDEENSQWFTHGDIRGHIIRWSNGTTWVHIFGSVDSDY